MRNDRAVRVKRVKTDVLRLRAVFFVLDALDVLYAAVAHPAVIPAHRPDHDLIRRKQWKHLIKNARHKLRVVVHQHIILVIGMHLFGVLDRLIHAAVPEQSAVAVD